MARTIEQEQEAVCAEKIRELELKKEIWRRAGWDEVRRCWTDGPHNSMFGGTPRLVKMRMHWGGIVAAAPQLVLAAVARGDATLMED